MADTKDIETKENKKGVNYSKKKKKKNLWEMIARVQAWDLNWADMQSIVKK